jgi:hypothetical protein
MKHEETKELLAPAALDALEERRRRGEQRRALDAHLAGCADCRASWSLRDATASLVYAAPAASPAPELRARILTAVKSQPQDARRRLPSNGGARPPLRKLQRQFARRIREATRGARCQDQPPRLMFGSLAASLAVAALLITLGARLAAQRPAARRTRAPLRNRRPDAAGTARTRADRELLAAPEAHTATLAGHENGRARARAPDLRREHRDAPC